MTLEEAREALWEAIATSTWEDVETALRAYGLAVLETVKATGSSGEEHHSWDYDFADVRRRIEELGKV